MSSVFVDGLAFVIGASDKLVVAAQSNVSNTNIEFTRDGVEKSPVIPDAISPIKSVNLPETGINTKITTIRTTKLIKPLRIRVLERAPIATITNITNDMKIIVMMKYLNACSSPLENPNFSDTVCMILPMNPVA